MGVEMRVFVMPRNNAFRPTAERLAAFVERLRSEEWVADPARPWFSEMTFKSMRSYKHAAATGAYVQRSGELRDETRYSGLPVSRSDLERLFTEVEHDDRRVRWPVERHGKTALRYPLSAAPPLSMEDAYYDVDLWLSDDYVYVSGETIEPFGDTTCACGAQLEREIDDQLFFARRLRVHCEVCGEPHDVSKRKAVWRHPETNAARHVSGGATFRFALVVDCGKCWPSPANFGVDAQLKTLCESCFDQPFYDVVDVY